MEKTLRWLNLLLISLTLLCYLSPFVDPSSFWFFSLIGMGYPWLLLFNMLFILWWIWLRKWYFLFSIGCILVGWNHFQSFVGLNTALPKQKEALTIMTMNSMVYRKLKGTTKKKFNQTLIDHNPDIILLQEGYARTSPIDKKTYPYIYQPTTKLLGIYSKYPFSHKGNMDIGNQANGCLFVDIKVNQQKIRVYNIHLQSNEVAQDASKLRKEGDLQEKETWLGIRDMLGKVKRSAGIRSEQAKLILAHLKKSKYPVIAAGDFNDTPLSYTYQLFAKTLNDGFKKRAMGLGITYDGSIPLLRIDYIWTDKRFQVHSHQIIKENFSDHYPVISRIQLK